MGIDGMVTVNDRSDSQNDLVPTRDFCAFASGLVWYDLSVVISYLYTASLLGRFPVPEQINHDLS